MKQTWIFKQIANLYEHRIDFPLENPPKYPWVAGRMRGWGKGAIICNLPHPTSMETWIPFGRIPENTIYELCREGRFRTERSLTLAGLVREWEQQLGAKLRTLVEEDGNVVLYAQETPEKPEERLPETNAENSWADRNYKYLQIWIFGAEKNRNIR